MRKPVDENRWQRIASLLDELLELPEAQRPARLAVLCEDDAGLRAEIEALLETEGRRGLLDLPAEDYLATLLDDARAERKRESARASRTPATDSTGSDPSRSHDARFLPGTLLDGRYRIVNRLGRGGMGEVFRADDLKLGQAVALKFLSEELTGGEELRARFLSEVKLARQVAHPNVCRVYDVGETEGQLFLSMEYVEGEDLASLLKRIGRLPREKAVQIAQQLCAGLAAAHGEGILHRDLKPANVMLDQRGRVRITDFGLAGLAEELEGAEVLSGTPAYMSPEQLAGKGVSIRSDLYALGLLLYELFTGKRAFEGRSWDEVKRARERAPSTPSSHVAGIDPTVERVILRCLEEDPTDRPSSAREVAAALPGGDPLAAALAAGETPSPEMVAAAGPAGRLSSRAAVSLLAATLAVLILVAGLAGRSFLINRVPYQKPAAALASDAREILAGLGYVDPPLDSAHEFRRNSDYLRWVARTNPAPDRWRALSLPGQAAFRFHYRQAPQLLDPWNWTGEILDDDPAPKPGDVRLITDLRGKLRFLSVVPPAAAAPADEAPPPDWSPLFAAAGLVMDDFVPTRPTRQPPLFADRRAAWNGVLPEAGDLPVRVEAASNGLQFVFFETVLPSDPYWSGTSGDEQSKAGSRLLTRLVWSVLYVSALAVTLVLAVRNLGTGRGDRRGAARLAALVLAARLGWWLLAGHHLPSFWRELGLASVAAGRALFVAAVAWLMYVAFEPLLRRIWPQFLISWSRLLAGRFRDPLVGRDILGGVLAGAVCIVLASQLHVLIPEWLAWSNPPFPLPYPGPQFYSPVTDPLLGARHALAAVLTALLTGVWGNMVILAFLLGVLTLVRKRWIACGVFVGFAATLGWTAQFSDYSVLGLSLSGMTWGVITLVIFRRGFLMSIAGCFTLCLYNAFPITADVSSPYFSTSLFALGLLAALAAYGCRISIGLRQRRADPVIGVSLDPRG